MLLVLALLVLQDPAPPAQPALTPAERAAFEAAARFSEERGGLGLVIRKGGEVVFERYAEGFDAERTNDLLGGTKSFWGVAALAAVEDGLLTLDEELAETITEWKAVPAKDSMTVRQLLQLCSGLDARSRWVRKPKTPDKGRAALDAAVLHAPGERFQDGPAPFYVFGELLERKLADRGEGPLEYLRRRVLDPLGIEVRFWARDPAGNLLMPEGAYLSPRDWSRFGQLLVDRGRVGGRQLIAAELLDECARPSAANPGYGLGFWLFEALRVRAGPQDEGDGETPEGVADETLEGLPRDLLFASGYRHQRLYVMPSLGLVVARQGIPGPAWPDARFLRLVLGLDPPPAADGDSDEG